MKKKEEILKSSSALSQLENGNVSREISFRMHRKNILRKTLTSDRWRGAARKVKVR